MFRVKNQKQFLSIPKSEMDDNSVKRYVPDSAKETSWKKKDNFDIVCPSFFQDLSCNFKKKSLLTPLYMKVKKSIPAEKIANLL